MWLSKDIRKATSAFTFPSPTNDTPGLAGTSSLSGTGAVPGIINNSGPNSVTSAFQTVLESLSGNVLRRPIYISLNAGALLYSACPGSASSSSSSLGLTADEILDIAVVAGSDPNVSTSTCMSVRS